MLLGIMLLASRTESAIGYRLDRGFRSAANSILSIDFAPVKALRDSRLAKLIPPDSSGPGSAPDVDYLVTKRRAGDVSVTIPAVTRKTPIAVLERIDRSIVTRERAQVVRIYGDRGEFVGTFVDGVFKRAER